MSKKEELPIVVNQYNDRRSVRLSSDLFDVSKVIAKFESTHSVKLIYALAQSVQEWEALEFRPISFPISVVFQYLGIERSNRRHLLLKEALDEIQGTPLRIATPKKNGGTSYSGISWITTYQFSTDQQDLNIVLNPTIAPYLLQLSQYTSIQPKNYIALSTAYQTWFYAYLKNKEKLGRFQVSIEELKELLSVSDKKAYNDSMKGTNVFLSRVLGITISSQAKEENRLSKKEKRVPKFVPWDYVVDKGNKPTGTIFHINRVTDLSVAVRAIKNGRQYAYLEFDFRILRNKTPKEINSLTVSSTQPELFPVLEEDTWVSLTEYQIKEMMNSLGINNIKELLRMNHATMRFLGDSICMLEKYYERIFSK